MLSLSKTRIKRPFIETFGESRRLLRHIHRWRVRRDPRSGQEVYNAVKPIVLKTAGSFSNSGLPEHRKSVMFEDMVACGYLGVCAALESYNPAHGISVFRYARVTAAYEIIAYLRGEQGPVPKGKMFGHYNHVGMPAVCEKQCDAPPEEVEKNFTADPSDDITLGIALMTAVNNLPKKQKEAFTWVRVAGFTSKETSVLLGISLRSVYDHLEKAEKSLYKSLSS